MPQDRNAETRPFVTVRSRGFTLVELLVVIAIIGVLIALLLPAVQQAREAARRNQCLSNLRQMSLGLLNYESANGSFPPAFEYPENANPGLLTNFGPNWVVRLLPYIEQAPVYDRIDFSTFLNNEENAQVRQTEVSSLRCPSDSFNRQVLTLPGPRRSVTSWARGNYAANAGNGPLLSGHSSGNHINGPDSPGWQNGRIRGVIGPNVAATLKQVTDGLSNTILIGEVRAGVTSEDRRGTWAIGQAGASVLFWYGSGGDANGPNVCTPNADDVAGPNPSDLPLLKRECMPDYTGDDWNNQATTRSTHFGGVNLGMADGSAHFVSDDIETSGPWGQWGTIWDKLIASADGEVIDDMPF